MPFKKTPPLYTTWRGMIRRCTNPNFKQWADYGGRGIAVCARWRRDFHAFAADMGERPAHHVLDRIDNNLGYSPENCRWATRSLSQRNTRMTRIVQIDGREYVAADLADISGMKVDTIIVRAEAGLPYADVMASGRRVFKPGLAVGGIANGQRQRAKTHCPQGHTYTTENTGVTPQGWRVCRTCRRLKEARKRASTFLA